MNFHTFCRSCHFQLRRAVTTYNKQTAACSRNVSQKTRNISTNERSTDTVVRRGWKDALLTPIHAYGRLQKRRPYVTQVSTMATVFFTGDLSAQCVGSQMFSTKEYEPMRGVRSAIIGAIWAIPAYHWFIWLGRQFHYSTWIRSIGTKILVQQSLFVPVVNTYFFGMQTLLAGGSFEDAKERVKAAVPVSWKNSWKLWPMVTAISFTYIPPQYRSAFGSLFATVWQTYLSWVNQRAEAGQSSIVRRTSEAVA
jgi:protein Mpv17